MSWFSRVRNAFYSQRLDREIAEELEDHLARRTESLRVAGLEETEAQCQAKLLLGNRTRLEESTREARVKPNKRRKSLIGKLPTLMRAIT